MATIKLKTQIISPAMQKGLLTLHKAVFFAVFAAVIDQASANGKDSAKRVFDNLSTVISQSESNGASWLIDKAPVNAAHFAKRLIAYCLPIDVFSAADRRLALKKLQSLLPFIIIYG